MPRSATRSTRNAVTHWLTALPVLARPEARTLLVVGLGGGMALEVVPRVDRADRRDRARARGARGQSASSRSALARPARRSARARPPQRRAQRAAARAARYDAIVSQPSHPWTAGASHLYTREFFELVRSRLAPDGVFVQWIGLPFVDEALFRSCSRRCSTCSRTCGCTRRRPTARSCSSRPLNRSTWTTACRARSPRARAVRRARHPRSGGRRRRACCSTRRRSASSRAAPR